MTHRLSFRRIFVTALALLTVASLAAAEPRPALVVLITIDQFRADYLPRFREHFVAGGFNLLLGGGADFVDCHYQHSATKTAPGHALIASGVHANINGIIANDWIDRTSFKRLNCVEDDGVQLLGLAKPRGGVRLPGANPPGASPRNFLATTIGDQLKLARGGRPKVIGIGGKDRAAILLGGHLADAAYWIHNGEFISSTYYLRELPAWVRTFNAGNPIDGCFGKTWDRLLPAAAYEALLGPDDAPGEVTDWGLGRTFPRIVNGGAEKIGAAFYNAFDSSPFMNEVIVDFARAAVQNENLGGRGVTDLLGLSLSANDYVGHSFGPDSHEVMDMLLRADRLLADFFKFLDARVGLKNCLIVVTGDHGAAPLPEHVKAMNPALDSGRVDGVRVIKTCEAALEQAFGPLGGGRHWLVLDATALLFAPGVLQEKNLAPAAAEAVVRDALLTMDFVADAWTRADLETGKAGGEFGAATLLSFNRARSGDVVFLQKPYWIDRKNGTNHSTPYNYDNHVPLLFFGVGVKPGTYTQRVEPEDIVPTLAHLLAIPAPPQARGHLLF